MARDLNEVETGNSLLFAEDLQDKPELKLITSKVYDANEVKDRENTPWPKFGEWLYVQHGSVEKYAVAHAGLIEALQEHGVQSGDVFEITSYDRPGDEDHSPYEVEIETQT